MFPYVFCIEISKNIHIHNYTNKHSRYETKKNQVRASAASEGADVHAKPGTNPNPNPNPCPNPTLVPSSDPRPGTMLNPPTVGVIAWLITLPLAAPAPAPRLPNGKGKAKAPAPAPGRCVFNG